MSWTFSTRLQSVAARNTVVPTYLWSRSKASYTARYDGPKPVPRAMYASWRSSPDASFGGSGLMTSVPAAAQSMTRSRVYGVWFWTCVMMPHGESPTFAADAGVFPGGVSTGIRNVRRNVLWAADAGDALLRTIWTANPVTQSEGGPSLLRHSANTLTGRLVELFQDCCQRW